MADTTNNNKYLWVKDFTQDDLKDFYEKFAEIEKDRSIPIIPIFVDSFGGSAFTLLAMRDIIKSSCKPVATICLGKAMSAGALLLAAGTKGYRFVSPDSQIMIHEISSVTFGKFSDMQVDVSFTKKLNKKVFENLSQDTGIKAEKFIKEICKRKNTDWFLTSVEAKKWGLVDYISVPKIITKDAICEFLRIKP